MTFKGKSAKSTVTPLLTLCGQKVKSADHYKYLGIVLILSSQVTKTFRDDCDINIVRQTSCEPLFPDVRMQLKKYFFIPVVLSYMHRNYGAMLRSHACRERLRVAYNFGCRALYNLPWRASVSSHQV